MNNQDHIKLAYCRFKASQEEGMQKKADGLSAIGKTFGKAFGNRFIDSVKGGVRDLVLPFQLFKKDKGAFMDSIKKDDYLHQAGGSLLRPRATNMGESGMRFDRFANLDDDAYNAISSAQPKMWGKMRNPFQSGDSHWYAGLDDAGKSALSKYRTRARRGVGGDIAPERLNYARSKFLRNTVGKEMNDANPAVFKDYYKKYGQPGDGGWFAQEAGRRAGTVAGGLGAYAAITNMPVSGAEWAGGLSAVPGARARGIEGANQGAADQMHKFRNKGFMDRMGDAFNPNRVVQDLYSPENIGKSGIAHHYMYGPGKQEQVKGPGIMGYARELALPFFSGSALDQSVQSNGLRQFQKMGSISNMTATQQLHFVKEALASRGAKLLFKGLGNTAKEFGKKFTRSGKPMHMDDFGTPGRDGGPVRGMFRSIAKADRAAAGTSKFSPERSRLAQKLLTARKQQYTPNSGTYAQTNWRGKITNPEQLAHEVADAPRRRALLNGLTSDAAPPVNKSEFWYDAATDASRPRTPITGATTTPNAAAAKADLEEMEPRGWAPYYYTPSFLPGSAIEANYLAREAAEEAASAARRAGRTMTPNAAAAKADAFTNEGQTGRWHGSAPNSDDVVGAAPANGGGSFPLALTPNTASSGASSSAPGLWDDIKERVGGAWDIAKEHPWHTGGAALAAPALVGSFFGGRHSVSDGAYNAGYGAGSAGAAQMYSDQNPFARFGAAAFPDMAMNRVMQQYPDLMAAYQRAGSRRGQPAGSRSNYDANNAQR